MRPTTIMEKYENAEHVLTAKIVSAKLIKNENSINEYNRELVEATYELIEQFKGDSNPPVVRAEVFSPGNCMLGLQVGSTYLFYLSDFGSFSRWPTSSSFVTWNLEGTLVVPELEELRELRAKNN